MRTMRTIELGNKEYTTDAIICSISGTMGLPTKRLKHVVTHTPKQTTGVYVLEVIGQNPVTLTDYNLDEAIERFNAVA